MSQAERRIPYTSALQLPTPFTIRSIETDNYRTKTFVLDAGLDAKPGQFLMVWLPRFDEKPFSLVSANPVTLMVTAVGPFTRLLHEKREGDRLWIRGPYGNGFRPPQSRLRAAFVGGGYGVAPLLWLARAWRKRLAALTVVVGAGKAEDLLYVERFYSLRESMGGARPVTNIVTCTEDGSAGATGRVTDLLAGPVEAGEIDLICACGPNAMLTAIERLGREFGIPLQLSWEAYMRCGIGLCGSCELGGKVLCLDGPVLAH